MPGVAHPPTRAVPRADMPLPLPSMPLPSMPRPAPPPSAEFQIQFLKDVQRLLDEGQMTATYKFALVHAIADLAVRLGDDTGGELPIPIREIGERFVELYWPQVAPWHGPHGGAVLLQNTGKQAEIIRKVHEARAGWGDRLDRARRQDHEWQTLTREVSGVVRKMPLWRLQRVGRQVRDFLYEQDRIEGSGARAAIVLRPGIAYCLRAFHPLVLDLVRSSWTGWLRRQNHGVLGERADLGAFLFGATRTELSRIREPLLELQSGECFYCAKGVKPADAHVDHFIPWSRYAVDLGHNFVVAHNRCNGAKSDHIAAVPHLERWVARNDQADYDLDAIFREVGMEADRLASTQITRWAYQRVADHEGLVWLRGSRSDDLIPLEPAWQGLLVQAG
jgi:5-methylcytosine-specific restriction endonuclease McrA